MHQPHENERPNKRSLVLKYANRRYDGGSEIELIREIERKHAIRQLIRLQHMQMERQRDSFLPLDDEDAPVSGEPACAVAALPATQHTQEPHRPQVAGRVQPVPAAPSRKSARVLEALIMGPLEICVGAVGMLTSLLAIITFSYNRNPALRDQSRSVFRDCVRTFFKGFYDTAIAPGRAIHRALARPA